MHLVASRPFGFFDYVRIPYATSPDGPVEEGRLGGDLDWVRDTDTGHTLWWPRQGGALGALVGAYRVGAFPVFGHVLTDDEAAASVALLGGTWDQHEPARAQDGRAVAHVWRSTNGDVLLPFDPAETMQYCWSERYRALLGSPTRDRVRTAMLRAYYGVRRMIPRSLQIRMRQLLAAASSPPAFPAWPIEDGLAEMYRWLFSITAEVADGPVPWISPWPDGCSWAFVLTHDVDTAEGFAQIEQLRAIERRAGLTSSWNIVPERYPIEDRVLRDLQAEGCELGVHGLRHDGRDLESLDTLQARLPAMRAFASRWGADGFRAPATHRVWDWMPRMGFDYDSSSPDTDPYEPTPGGCCTYFPFFNEDMVELPITLPQDHTLFVILRQQRSNVWLEKARHIRDRGGMALLITHPDYVRKTPRILDGYAALLQAFSGDPSAWRALPREVNAWVRARAASTIVPTAAGWAVQGPAAPRGRVCLAGGPAERIAAVG